MKIWVVEQEILFNKGWEHNSWGFYSSREEAESAIIECLEDYPEEIVATAYKERFEDDLGFSMTVPETEEQRASRYNVCIQELNEKLGD